MSQYQTKQSVKLDGVLYPPGSVLPKMDDTTIKSLIDADAIIACGTSAAETPVKIKAAKTVKAVETEDTPEEKDGGL